MLWTTRTTTDANAQAPTSRRVYQGGLSGPPASELSQGGCIAQCLGPHLPAVGGGQKFADPGNGPAPCQGLGPLAGKLACHAGQLQPLAGPADGEPG